MPELVHTSTAGGTPEGSKSADLSAPRHFSRRQWISALALASVAVASTANAVHGVFKRSSPGYVAPADPMTWDEKNAARLAADEREALGDKLASNIEIAVARNSKAFIEWNRNRGQTVNIEARREVMIAVPGAHYLDVDFPANSKSGKVELTISASISSWEETRPIAYVEIIPNPCDGENDYVSVYLAKRGSNKFAKR